MQSYNLDPNAAKAADNIHSRIEQTGKYLGMLTRAEPVTSAKGSKGVDISFKADTGATADYLTIWTHNGEGKPLMGFNTLMALMTCLKVKNINAENGDIEKYDPDTKQRAKVNVPLFKDMMNKPIGLLLQMEEYAKNAGGTAWKPSIFAAFSTDEFTASEILNQAKKPETLARMVLALKDKPLKGNAAKPAAAPASMSENPGADMLDSEIPF